MKISKRIACFFVAVFTLVMALSMQAFAAESIDLSRQASLSISYRNAVEPLIGAEFTVYHVASVNESGELNAMESFRSYPVNIHINNESDPNVSALALESYVLRDDVNPVVSGKTDENGMLVFSDLVPGLYLVSGSLHEQYDRSYSIEPFMVLLPSMDEAEHILSYDMTVYPKHESRKSDGSMISRKVLKIWDDGQEDDRPKEIVVHLLCNGDVYDSAVLNAANNWRHTWNDLDGSCHWTVVEDAVEGYTVSMEKEGVTFMITNTFSGSSSATKDPVTQGASSLPQTGQLWWPVPAFIAIGLLFVIIGMLLVRGNRHEK